MFKQAFCCRAPVLGAFFLLSALFFLHHDIVFGGKTFFSAWTAGVMPTGAWDNVSNRTIHSFDGAGGVWSPLPQTRALHDAWEAGSIPLWNPYMGGGAPLAANSDSIAFNPLRLPLYLFPNLATWDAYCLFRLFIAGFGMFLFLRVLRFSFFSSLVGGVFFQSCGYFILYVNLTHPDVEVLLPSLFLLAEKLRAEPEKGVWFLLFSCTVYLALNGGNPEASLLAVSSTLLWFLWRYVTVAEPSGKGKEKTLKVFAFALSTGFLLASVQLIPFIEYWFYSFNNHDAGNIGVVNGMVSDSFPQSLITLFIPWFFGAPFQGWLPLEVSSFGRGYLVPVCFFLALSGVFATFFLKEWRSPSFFFTLFLLLVLLKVYGVFPVHEAGKLPLLNLIIYVKYTGALIAFASAFLAARGVDVFLASSGRFVLFLGCGAFLFSVLFVFVIYISLPQLSGEGVVAYVHSQLFAAGGFILLAMGLMYVIRVFPFLKSVALVLFLFILLAESYLVIPVAGFDKKWEERFDPFKKAPYVQMLQGHLQHGRISAVGAYLFPDYATAFHISDVRMLDAMMPKRYMSYIRSVVPVEAGGYYTGAEHFHYASVGYQRMLDLFGVKFLLAQIPLDIPGLALIYSKEVLIYENLDVLPRVFLTDRYRTVEKPEQVLELLQDKNFNLRDELVLEKELPAEIRKKLKAGSHTVKGSSEPGSAEIIQYGWNRAEIEVDAKEDSLLFLSDTFFPGWQAEVDGTQAEIFQADYLFRAVFVEKGNHRVVFSYRPFSFTLGFVMSLSGFLFLAGYAFRHRVCKVSS